jgi:hypothetical protein
MISFAARAVENRLANLRKGRGLRSSTLRAGRYRYVVLRYAVLAGTTRPKLITDA